MQLINTKTGWTAWWEPLLQLLPRHDPARELMLRRRTELVIASEGYSIVRYGGLKTSSTKTNALGPFPTPAEACTQLRSGEEVVIAVKPEKCLVRDATLPRSARSKLNEILLLDVARVTPFQPDSVYSAGIVTGETSGKASLLVKHIIIRKDIITEVAEQVVQSGAKAIGLSVTGSPIALSLDGLSFALTKRQKWSRLLAASIVAAIMGSAALLFGQSVKFETLAASAASETAPFLPIVADVKEKLDRRKASSLELQALQQRKAGMLSRVAVLEEFSKVLPDDVFLRNLSIDGGNASAEGDAGDPEELIKNLESSPFFKEVAFNAPVVHNPGETLSHFAIKLRFEQSLAPQKE
jgi:general secretion pathway protein L